MVSLPLGCGEEKDIQMISSGEMDVWWVQHLLENQLKKQKCHQLQSMEKKGRTLHLCHGWDLTGAPYTIPAAVWALLTSPCGKVSASIAHSYQMRLGSTQTDCWIHWEKKYYTLLRFKAEPAECRNIWRQRNKNLIQEDKTAGEHVLRHL